jgi:quercetin dioxygenase-like cupin family protein
MRRALTKRLALIAIALGLLTVGGFAAGQATPPARMIGIKGKPTVMDLGPEIDGMEGRMLRISFVTVDPGGGTPLHTHGDRPEIIYVTTGHLTEHRNGESKEYGPGETITSGKNTSHWIENRSSEQVTFIATSIIKKR